MRNEQWLFYEIFSVFGQIKNLWTDKIASQTSTPNSGKPGVRNFSNCLLREFTARYAWKNVQMNLKSKTTNIFNSWIINSLQCDYSINEFWFFSSTKRTSIKFRILRVVSREVRSLKSHSQILLVRLQKKNKNLEILSFFLEVDLIGQNHSIVISASAATATIAVRIPKNCHAGVEKAGLKDGKQVKPLA